MSESRKTKIGYPTMRGGTAPPAEPPSGSAPADAGVDADADADASAPVGPAGAERVSGPIAREAVEPHRDPRALLAGRYLLLRPLGVGGMSTVYLAEHSRIGKRVAIKILADKHRDKPVLHERFLREARATARIDHPNVIEISDFGETEQGAPFFVMEYLEGEDLGRTLKRQGPLPWPRVAHFVVQIARGLEAAHALGLIHRDLKPDNCIRVERGGDPDCIKVIDFGIAKLTGDDTERLTKTGVVVGTPEYVAPEQAQGQEVDHRVDVYALGIIMFELITGKLPFFGDHYADVLLSQAYEAAPSFAEVAPDLAVPPGVEAIVRKALQKQPAHRFQSMAELAAAVEDLAFGRRIETMDDDAGGRPQLGGPMQFAGGGKRAPAPSGAVPVVAERPRAWAGPAFAAFGLLALVAAVIISWPTWRAALADADADADADAAAKVEATPGVGPGDPEDPTAAKGSGAAPEPAPTLSATIDVIIETNVDATVVEPESGAVLGKTNDPAGFALARGREPVPLRLVAPGYLDYDFQLVPNGDRKFSHDLEPGSGSAAKPTRPRSSKVAQPADGTSEPKAPTVKDHEELKNPFGH